MKDDFLNSSKKKEKNKNIINGISCNSNKNIKINNNYNINDEGKNENNIKRKKIKNSNKCNMRNIIITKKKVNYSNNNSFMNKSCENRNNINIIEIIPKNRFKIENMQIEKKNNNNNNKIKNDNNNIDGKKNINKENTPKDNITKNKKEENNKNMNDNNYNIIRSIIVKDVCSKDKKLNVYIKYYECNFPNFIKTSNIDNFYKNNNQHLSIISTESFTLHNITKNKFIIKDNNGIHKNSRYLQQILTSIIEEDEKSKANLSINNSNSVVSEEDSDKNETTSYNNIESSNFTHNIVIYLTNILQNIYDDNKKMILYIFMKNLKRIQNQLYLKNSLMKFNFMLKNETNNYNNYTNDSHEIVYNGINEIETNNGEQKNSSKSLLFYTADNSLLDINKGDNISIDSVLYKNFGIIDNDNIIIPKKHFSSSSMNCFENNRNIKPFDINKRKKIINRKNKLKKFIKGINKKIFKNYFNFWKKINIDEKYENEKKNKNNNNKDNPNNGINITNINKEKNNIIESNIDNLYNNNKEKCLDNGIDIKNKEIEIKNNEINNKREEIDKKINVFKIFLIKNVLKKNKIMKK